MTEERQAIVKYLREVSDMYAEDPAILGEGDDTRGRVSDTLDVCAKDIEDMHSDTLPGNNK